MLRSLCFVAIALLALLDLSCAHKLSACSECGPGRVCQPLELPGGARFNQCYTPCQSDSSCGAGQTCNCDSAECSHHSASIPQNVCVGAERRRDDEFENRFVIDERDRRFCQGCPAGEMCVDLGTAGKPDPRCVKQCTRDAECAADTVCNCETAECSSHRGDLTPNICVIRVEWKPPAAGAIP